MATSAILPSILIGLAILLVLRRRQRNNLDDVHHLPSKILPYLDAVVKEGRVFLLPKLSVSIDANA
jgi:hypothetical protein